MYVSTENRTTCKLGMKFGKIWNGVSAPQLGAINAPKMATMMAVRTKAINVVDILAIANFPTGRVNCVLKYLHTPARKRLRSLKEANPHKLTY